VSRRAGSLLPTLPKAGWVMVGGMGLGCVGTGFAYSFIVIYLHYARGLSLAFSGLCLSLVAVGGLVVAPLVGICADRFGPKRVLITALLVSSAGSALLALASRPWEAVCVALLFGVGSVSIDAPEMTLLAVVVLPRQRSAAFAVSYAAFSAGLSAGALAGGWFVDIARPATFEAAFLVAALPYLAYAVIVWRFVRPQTARTRAPAAAVRGAAESRGARGSVLAGYGSVLRDRAFALLLLFNFAIFAVSFSQLNAAYPAYAVGEGQFSTRVVGLGLGANAVAILVAQLLMLRLLTGRRRTRALALACALGAVCWFVVLVAAHAGGRFGVVGIVLSVAILGLGETALSPSLYPMANDLAPDRLRGRYNALMFMTEGGGRVLGPLVAGFMLAAGGGDALMVGLGIAMAATAVLTLVLERAVPLSANVITGTEDDDAGEAAVIESAAGF
jgi:MFS family permease